MGRWSSRTTTARPQTERSGVQAKTAGPKHCSNGHRKNHGKRAPRPGNTSYHGTANVAFPATDRRLLLRLPNVRPHGTHQPTTFRGKGNIRLRWTIMPTTDRRHTTLDSTRRVALLSHMYHGYMRGTQGDKLDSTAVTADTSESKMGP